MKRYIIRIFFIITFNIKRIAPGTPSKIQSFSGMFSLTLTQHFLDPSSTEPLALLDEGFVRVRSACEFLLVLFDQTVKVIMLSVLELPLRWFGILKTQKLS